MGLSWAWPENIHERGLLLTAHDKLHCQVLCIYIRVMVHQAYYIEEFCHNSDGAELNYVYCSPLLSLSLLVSL